METLDGKVACITGASRGIGAETARLIARRGAAVVIGYGSARDEAQSVADAITSAGGRAVISGGDVRKSETAEAAVNAAIENFGQLDILVTAAGVNHWSRLDGISGEDVTAVMDVNVGGTLLAIRAAAARMSEGGSIVTLSSRFAQNAQPGFSLYAASKAAVIALTEGFAKELGERGIRVNSVAPGLIETDMTRQAVAERGDAVAAQTPLGRIGQPEDVARVIAMLASEDARWVTGRTIRADGGIV